ncbi:MAG: HEAT repeat domain-containing protein [Chloroflexota bacterium]
MPILGPNISALQAKRDLAGLIQACKSKDLRTRCAALHALGELRDPRALPTLKECLLSNASQSPEKTEAAEALGKLGDASTLDALLEANEISKARERQEIDDSLDTRDKTYRPGFYVNRIAADEYALRAAIAQAIARLGGARALEALFQLLATETGAMASPVKTAIKNAIADALENQDAQIVPFLCAQLKHASVDVRECAARCLDEFEDTRAIDALLDAASDAQEHYAVREAALIGLGKIGDASALPELDALTRSGNRGLARDAKQCVIAIRQRLNLPTITGF